MQTPTDGNTLYGIAGIAVCRAISMFALLLRLRRNPSAGTQEREGCVHMVSVSLPLSWHNCSLLCKRALSRALLHSTVNKAMQSGNNHTKMTTICLFVSACRSQWASLATDHTTLRKHNNIQHHGFKKNKENVKGCSRFVISLPLITFFFPLSALCPSLSYCKWVIYQP